MKTLITLLLCAVSAACATKPEPQLTLTRTVYKTVPVPANYRVSCKRSEVTKQATPSAHDLLVMTDEQRASAYFVLIVNLNTDIDLCITKDELFNKWLDKQEALINEHNKAQAK